jgi:hypothetical protein
MQKKIKGHSKLCETSIPCGSFIINANVNYPVPSDKGNKQNERPFEGICGSFRL